jgi:hypothetical protein
VLLILSFLSFCPLLSYTLLPPLLDLSKTITAKPHGVVVNPCAAPVIATEICDVLSPE